MKNQVSALELHYIVKELQDLVDGKVDKIYHPEKNELLLQLHVPGKGKKILRILAPNFLYLTTYKPKQEEPSGFCMYLRKKLSNARLRGVEQKDFERILEFKFETKEEKFSLMVELFSKGNILLLQDNVILSAIEYKKWKDRTIKPKEEYTYPKLNFNFLKLTEKELGGLLSKSDKESVVKALAIELGLGGLYSEEACLVAGVEKDQSPGKFKDVKKLFDSLKSLRNKKIIPSKVDSEIVMFGLKSKETESVSGSFNELLDAELTKAAIKDVELKQEKVKNKDMDKVERIIKSQRATIKKLKKKEGEERDKAEAIYNNYQMIKDVLDKVNEVRGKLSLNEIKEKLKGHKIIKELNTKEKTITLELK